MIKLKTLLSEITLRLPDGGETSFSIKNDTLKINYIKAEKDEFGMPIRGTNVVKRFIDLIRIKYPQVKFISGEAINNNMVNALKKLFPNEELERNKKFVIKL